MNANQTKQLTLQARNKLITDKEISWITLSKFIYDFIEKTALLGKFELILDLRSDYFTQFDSKDFAFIKNKLEEQGYSIDYSLERTPDGKRAIIIRW